MLINIFLKIPFLIYIILLLIGMRRDNAKISVYFLYQYSFVILSKLSLGEIGGFFVMLFINMLALILGIRKIVKRRKKVKPLRVILYQMISFTELYLAVYIALILIGGLLV